MTTLFSIIFLIIAGIVAKFVAIYVLNLVGAPGALIAGKPERPYKTKYILGCIIATIGQSYLYLGYTAFIVNWTLLVVSNQGVSFVIWPIALFVSTMPIGLTHLDADKEARADGYKTNAQIQALLLTSIMNFIAFFVFAFMPGIMRTVYAWVPYISS